MPLSTPKAKAHISYPVIRRGPKMGTIKLSRGHMALLPVGAAYRFSAESPATLMIQTIDGPVTQHKWAEFCHQ